MTSGRISKTLALQKSSVYLHWHEVFTFCFLPFGMTCCDLLSSRKMIRVACLSWVPEAAWLLSHWLEQCGTSEVPWNGPHRVTVFAGPVSLSCFWDLPLRDSRVFLLSWQVYELHMRTGTALTPLWPSSCLCTSTWSLEINTSWALLTCL